MQSLTNTDKANLCIFNICVTTDVKQSNVHKRWGSVLVQVANKLDNPSSFKRVEGDIFLMSNSLGKLCDFWYKDPEIKAEADKIWKAYGN